MNYGVLSFYNINTPTQTFKLFCYPLSVNKLADFLIGDNMKRVFASVLAFALLVSTNTNANNPTYFRNKPPIHNYLVQKPNSLQTYPSAKTPPTNTNKKTLFSRKIKGIEISITRDELSFNMKGEDVLLGGKHQLSKDPPISISVSSDEKYIFMISENGVIIVFSLETISLSSNTFLPEDSFLKESIVDPKSKLFQVGEWFCLATPSPKPMLVWMKWDLMNHFSYASEILTIPSIERVDFEIGKDALIIILPDKKISVPIPKE